MYNSILYKKQCLINYLEIIHKNAGNSQDRNKEDANYNSISGKISIKTEVQGTQFEGRTARIEKLKMGDEINIIREPNNQYDENTLAVRNKDGESLGNLSKWLAEKISPLIDCDALNIIKTKVSYVEPLSQRSGRCKKALLFVEMELVFKKFEINSENGCIICRLGGDQARMWVQKLDIIKCNIPLKDAKLLFELYNRFCNEYEGIQTGESNYSYFGLDNLFDEVTEAREKMGAELNNNSELSYSKEIDTEAFYKYVLEMSKKEQQRYVGLDKYINEEYLDDTMKNLYGIFEDYAIDCDTYYWED